MANQHYDVIVLGSGFGGTLLAMILARQGRTVAVLEKKSHPRFAIGESSTPIADMILYDLSEQYDLSRLKPLATYGTLRAKYPDLIVGKKRGFSYFRHEAGKPFASGPDHHNELLVAASQDDHSSDTQWLRSSVDHFFANEMVAMNVPLFEHTQIDRIAHESPWRIEARTPEGSQHFTAEFLVDASGAAGTLIEALGIDRDPRMLCTNTGAIYGHFEHASLWHEIAVECGANTEDYPFCCDDAALHHLLDEGWMWQLRFDSGVTSIGIVLDRSDDDRIPSDLASFWHELIRRYPSIHQQLEHAILVSPTGGLVGSQRLQSLAMKTAGHDWAALPSTAGLIDPLHSTGIAHSLSGVERLAQILGQHWKQASLSANLRQYDIDLRLELRFIDQLISTCYRVRRNFEAFEAATMLYFAAAHSYETRRLNRSDANAFGFLNALSADFWTPAHCFNAMAQTVKASRFQPSEVKRFRDSIRRSIEPFNQAGLCDPAAEHMYRYTAIESKFGE